MLRFTFTEYLMKQELLFLGFEFIKPYGEQIFSELHDSSKVQMSHYLGMLGFCPSSPPSFFNEELILFRLKYKGKFATLNF